jgi:hypothetical protein
MSECIHECGREAADGEDSCDPCLICEVACAVEEGVEIPVGVGEALQRVATRVGRAYDSFGRTRR